MQSIRYSPYGENTHTSGTVGLQYHQRPIPIPRRLPPRRRHAGTGNVPNDLYHYGQRYYDPTTGRWTQPDPQGGPTEFAFAGMIP